MRNVIWLFAPAVLFAQVNVPYERIRDADKEPGNWLTYSRDYTGQRYSPLDQINTGNVGKLHVAWVHQVRELDDLETSPIVVDDTVFIGDGSVQWYVRQDRGVIDLSIVLRAAVGFRSLRDRFLYAIVNHL